MVDNKCEFYPCHFAGQDCTFCFCPIYPCKIEGAGEWIEDKNGNKIWDCSKCSIVHTRAGVEVIKRFMSKAMDGIKRN